ncbi:MAG: hypothetical protein Pars2KO_00710 [Parasphingorhabdus sp.]
MEHLGQSHNLLDTSQREMRFQSHIEVEIEREFGPSSSAIVTDVSEFGMGVTTSALLQAFDVITIVKMGYGRIRAEVRWVNGNKVGVLFSEPVGMDFYRTFNR